MITRVRPAVVPEREQRALYGAALTTADRAAMDGYCAICVACRAVAGDVDPLCESQQHRERFYGLPLDQRNRLRRSAGLMGPGLCR